MPQFHAVYVEYNAVFNCRDIVGPERFYPLYDEVFCKTVTVDAGDYGISRSDEVDFSEYELWQNGAEPVKGLVEQGTPVG
ncbi:MAG: hypothetical protein NT169_05060 [Chloroflexi bacterium]|nr:hypothetical protein [Chloroflexota bacterium]